MKIEVRTTMAFEDICKAIEHWLKIEGYHVDYMENKPLIRFERDFNDKVQAIVMLTNPIRVNLMYKQGEDVSPHKGENKDA